MQEGDPIGKKNRIYCIDSVPVRKDSESLQRPSSILAKGGAGANDPMFHQSMERERTTKNALRNKLTRSTGAIPDKHRLRGEDELCARENRGASFKVKQILPARKKKTHPRYNVWNKTVQEGKEKKMPRICRAPYGGRGVGAKKKLTPWREIQKGPAEILRKRTGAFRIGQSRGHITMVPNKDYSH